MRFLPVLNLIIFTFDIKEWYFEVYVRIGDGSRESIMVTSADTRNLWKYNSAFIWILQGQFLSFFNLVTSNSFFVLSLLCLWMMIARILLLTSGFFIGSYALITLEWSLHSNFWLTSSFNLLINVILLHSFVSQVLILHYIKHFAFKLYELTYYNQSVSYASLFLLWFPWVCT